MIKNEALLKAIIEDNLAVFTTIPPADYSQSTNLNLDLPNTYVMIDNKSGIVKPNNQTVLHVAAYHDSVEIFQYIVDYIKIPFNKPNAEGFLPIHLAAFGGAERVFAFILQRNPAAAQCELSQELKQLIYLATYSHSPTILKLLFKNGANPTSPRNRIDNPIKRAIQTKDINCLKILISANIKFTSSRNDTPLMFALRYNEYDAIPILLDAGEDPRVYVLSQGNLPDESVDCALSLACFQGHPPSVRAICSKYGGDLEPPPGTPIRGSPVHWICMSKSPEIARIMTQYPFDVNRRDRNGKTCVHSMVDRGAKEEDMVEILDILKLHGFLLNAPREQPPGSKQLLGPLVEVMESMSKPASVIKWFLNNGADVSLPFGKDGLTILEAAKKSKGLIKTFGIFYPEIIPRPPPPPAQPAPEPKKAETKAQKEAPAPAPQPAPAPAPAQKRFSLFGKRAK